MYYEEPDDEQIDRAVRPYISDNTSFMRWSTEIEKVHDLIDKDFIDRHRARIIDINKFLPLSNITSPESNSLFRLRRMNMSMEHDAGLIDLSEETALDNLADYNTTRGQNGFYQQALITQRREWKDNSKEEKRKGLWGKMFGNADRENAQMENMQG